MFKFTENTDIGSAAGASFHFEPPLLSIEIENKTTPDFLYDLQEVGEAFEDTRLALKQTGLSGEEREAAGRGQDENNRREQPASLLPL